MRYPSVLLLMVCFLSATARSSDTPDDQPVQLPVITTVAGKTLDEAALKDKVIVLDFWATWCGQCLKENAHLKKLYRQYHEKDVVFIGLAEEQDAETVKRYVKSQDITWHIALDEDQALAKRVGVKALPHAAILDRDRRIVWQGVPHEMDKALREAAERKE